MSWSNGHVGFGERYCDFCGEGESLGVGHLFSGVHKHSHICHSCVDYLAEVNVRKKVIAALAATTSGSEARKAARLHLDY